MPLRSPACCHVFIGEVGGFRVVVCRLKNEPISRTIPPAETRRATVKGEETVARPRWQEGCLRKRGKRKPVWVGSFREDAIAEDGSRVRRQRSVVLGLVSELGMREAKRLLCERLAAINGGKQKPQVLITFERFVLEYWEPNLYPLLRHSTVLNYRYLVRRYMLPFFGSMRLSEIGPADVQVFLTGVSKKIAPRTVLSLRNRLLKIFGTAGKWRYLESNPAVGAQVPELVDTRERLTLTPQQACALLAELAEPYRTMVLLALLSGMRRGELFGLRWGRVDVVERCVTVAESDYKGYSAPPKTRASRRKVFVGSVVCDALAGLRPESVQPDDLVFHSERGTPLNAENVRNRVLHPACDRAGIPRVGWHNFRYTYATWAEATGESIKALQAQLGHTDSRVTLNVYTQPMPVAQRRVASKVELVLQPVLLSSAAKFETGENTQDEKPKWIQ